MSSQISRGSSYSPSETLEYTALQFAVRRNSIEQVKYLIESGTELNTGSDPALHLALRKRNVDIAILLLEAGANFEIKDTHGDRPIHIACALGLLEVVKVLCALGCTVEVPTQEGLYPLHLAAKNGHMEVVRCLCAAGCNIEVRNSDNIRADITALKYGYNDIAELLDRLRATGQRDYFARQLVPTSRPALRLSLRLLGHCGVGKTSLAKSLGAGLFSSLFRRSSSLQSNKSRPSSPINTQIEMDVTSRQNSIQFEPTANYNSSSGIHVQNIDISNVGEITVWEFSGQETYFPVYHHFLWPSPYSLTAILFSLDDAPSIQVQQVCFWLNFLLARQKANLPSSDYGPIILIATHVDLTRAAKTQQGEWVCPDAQKTLESVQKLLPHISNLMDVVIIMDSNVPASFAFKQLKSIVANVKQNCIQQTIGTWTGLLESALTWLGNLRVDYKQFPVLARPLFSDLLRSHVNFLASDEHIQELLNQLHVMGEVYCIEYLVVLSVPWLGNQLLGELLSASFISNARTIGVYTAEDFQSCYTECDATSVLELLECLDLCVQCDVDEEIEYEFPVYIQTETLKGLWEPTDPRYSNRSSMHGGLRLYTSSGILHMFKSIFSHIQQTIGTWTGLLESALTWLGNLREDYKQFPVLARPLFSDLLRSHVNFLASDEHIQELLNQLHVMGEVYCIEYLVVLSVPWLGNQLLGELLSASFISNARTIGVYTAEDFQSCYTECDATSVLELLECLDLCVQCDVDEETEYEFPVYIQTETLKGLWEPTDPRYSNRSSMHGGLRLYTSSGILHMFKSIFSHIQVNLRRNLIAVYTDNESDLFQWSSGSKFCNMDLESLITLEEDEHGTQYIEVKVRGPFQSSQCCFYFLNNIMQTIMRAICKVCPGLLFETHILSPEDLRLYSDDPYCYSPQTVTSAVMEAESTLDVILYNPHTNSHETISQLIMFDDIDLARHIQWGCSLSVRELPEPLKLRFCGFLDPPDPHGQDWCLLALRLGLCQKKIAALASHHSSHTMRLLTTADCTIGALITSLHELDRQDAAELVLKSAHIYKVILEHAQV